MRLWRTRFTGNMKSAKLAEEGWIAFAVGVQRSLATPLQDAISGPERPEFNSGFSHRGSRGVGTSSGQSRTLAWPSLGHPSQAQLPVRAGYPFLSPGVATPRARAPGGSSCLKNARCLTAPLHANAARKLHAREKVQTGEKIRAPLAQRAKKTNSHLHHTIRPGGSWSPGGCS